MERSTELVGHTRLPDKDYVVGAKRMLAYKNKNGLIVWIEETFKHFEYGEIRSPARTKEEALQTFTYEIGHCVDDRLTS